MNYPYNGGDEFLNFIRRRQKKHSEWIQTNTEYNT